MRTRSPQVSSCTWARAVLLALLTVAIVTGTITAARPSLDPSARGPRIGQVATGTAPVGKVQSSAFNELALMPFPVAPAVPEREPPERSPLWLAEQNGDRPGHHPPVDHPPRHAA